MKRKKIYIFGSDKRMKYLCELFDKELFDSEHIAEASEGEIYRADYFIFPVGFDEKIIEKLRKENRESLFFVGNSDVEGDNVFDYFKDDVVTIKNTIPTAEGAIAVAIKESDFTLFGCQCLILGYGKVAKTLAGYLGCFGVNVTIAARKKCDRTLASINMFKSIHTDELENEIGKFDLIINTIPAKIIDSAILRKIKDGSLTIDLASKPGGVDFKEAEILEKKVIWALGLPGKVAPMTAATYIFDYINDIIKEQ